jgi:hypothetical protein
VQGMWHCMPCGSFVPRAVNHRIPVLNARLRTDQQYIRLHLSA